MGTEGEYSGGGMGARETRRVKEYGETKGERQQRSTVLRKRRSCSRDDRGKGRSELDRRSRAGGERSALAVGRRDELNQAHGLATARTQRRGCGWRGNGGRVTQLDGPARMQLDAQPVGLGRRMTEAVIANRAQAAWENVPKITFDKLDPWQSAGLAAMARVAILPLEGNGAVGDLEDSRVADGGAGDIGAQIFEGGGTVAGGLNVHAPILVPD